MRMMRMTNVKLLTKLQQAKKSIFRADQRQEQALEILLEYFNEDIGKSCCDHYDEEKHYQRERVLERLRFYGLIK